MTAAAGDAVHVALPPLPDSVGTARALVRSLCVSLGAKQPPSASQDTAVLLVSELVSNAVLHARSTVQLTLRGRGTSLRVEVSDRSDALPRVHHYSLEATTGRGLRLVDRLADRWGFDALDEGGKSVWFELGPPMRHAEPVQRRATPSARPNPAHPNTGRPRPAAPQLAGSRSVHLRRLPLLLQARAAEHHDGLVREFMLLASRSEQPLSTPARLGYLIEEFGHRLAAATHADDDAVQQALADGARELDLTFEATREAADAARHLGRLLTEADAFCRVGELMTLAAPADVVAYRRWYLDELLGQLSGMPPDPWPGPWD